MVRFSITVSIALSQNGVLKPMCELLEVIDEEVLFVLNSSCLEVCVFCQR